MGKHEEMTRYAFISHMEDYMKKLLTEPLKADTDDFLKSHGIEGPIALQMLLKRSNPDDESSAIIIRSEKIKDNGVDDNGKKKPESFTVKYKLPRKDYTKKMRNLYISLFENNIIDKCPITEDGEGGCMDGCAGATSCGASSGQFVQPLFGKPIKRKTLYLTEEQLQYIKEATAGDIGQGKGIACPMGGKVNKGSKDPFYGEANDHKDMMKKSWQNESSIHIKKENEGKFTATKKATGKSTEELTHSKNPLTKKRAIFAQNAKKWNHKKDE